MSQANKLLNWAISQLGTKADSNNVVKYNIDYGMPGQPWCVMFIWDGCRILNMSKVFMDGKKTASCTALYTKWAQPNGYNVKITDVKQGDWVIFNFGTSSNPSRHIGICESYDGANVTTIDGNTCAVGNEANGMCVMRRRRPLKYVEWVIRPPYADVVIAPPIKKTPIKNTGNAKADTHPIYYKVKKGDTLSAIAEKYGYKSYQDLLPLNPDIKDPNKIKVGQKIRVK